MGAFNPLPYQAPAATVVAAGIFLVAAVAASAAAALPLLLFRLLLLLFFQLHLQLLFQLLLLLSFLLLLLFPPLPLFLLLSLLLFLSDTLLEMKGYRFLSFPHDFLPIIESIECLAGILFFHCSSSVFVAVVGRRCDAVFLPRHALDKCPAVSHHQH